jgi:hypothetical protein
MEPIIELPLEIINIIFRYCDTYTLARVKSCASWTYKIPYTEKFTAYEVTQKGIHIAIINFKQYIKYICVGNTQVWMSKINIKINPTQPVDRFTVLVMKHLNDTSHVHRVILRPDLKGYQYLDGHAYPVIKWRVNNLGPGWMYNKFDMPGAFGCKLHIKVNRSTYEVEQIPY